MLEWNSGMGYKNTILLWRHYLAHHLESCMEQLFGSLVINSLGSVVNHGIVTHEFKVGLETKHFTSEGKKKWELGILSKLIFITPSKLIILTLNSVTVLYSLFLILSFMVLKSIGCLMIIEYPGAIASVTGNAKNPWGSFLERRAKVYIKPQVMHNQCWSAQYQWLDLFGLVLLSQSSLIIFWHKRTLPLLLTNIW